MYYIVKILFKSLLTEIIYKIAKIYFTSLLTDIIYNLALLIYKHTEVEYNLALA